MNIKVEEPFREQFLKEPFISSCEERFNDLKNIYPQRTFCGMERCPAWM